MMVVWFVGSGMGKGRRDLRGRLIGFWIWGVEVGVEGSLEVNKERVA